MLKAKEGEFFNPGFNSVEFDIIKSLAGLNNFRLSAKEWGGFPREFMLLVDLQCFMNKVVADMGFKGGGWHVAVL